MPPSAWFPESIFHTASRSVPPFLPNTQTTLRAICTASMHRVRTMRTDKTSPPTVIGPVDVVCDPVNGKSVHRRRTPRLDNRLHRTLSTQHHSPVCTQHAKHKILLLLSKFRANPPNVMDINLVKFGRVVFSARCRPNLYTSRAYVTMSVSVCLSVCL